MNSNNINHEKVEKLIKNYIKNTTIGCQYPISLDKIIKSEWENKDQNIIKVSYLTKENKPMLTLNNNNENIQVALIKDYSSISKQAFKMPLFK